MGLLPSQDLRRILQEDLLPNQGLHLILQEDLLPNFPENRSRFYLGETRVEQLK